MDNYLTFDNVSYSYHSLKGETPVLDGLSFSVKRGEFFAIVGPSGCGKSTLLSLIAGLLSPDSGSIYIDGAAIAQSKRKVGYMLQKDHLLEWRSTLKNVTLAPEINHTLTSSVFEKADEYMNTYGLIDFKNAKPSEMSGGMRQRAALIRTLMHEPELLLLDEPFSALDYQTRLEVSGDICQIIRKQKITTILITHDIGEAISIGDRVMVLTARPTRAKRLFDINLSLPPEERTPLTARNAPEFNSYFKQIWKEMTADD